MDYISNPNPDHISILSLVLWTEVTDERTGKVEDFNQDKWECGAVRPLSLCLAVNGCWHCVIHRPSFYLPFLLSHFWQSHPHSFINIHEMSPLIKHTHKELETQHRFTCLDKCSQKRVIVILNPAFNPVKGMFTLLILPVLSSGYETTTKANLYSVKMLDN